MKKKTLLIAIDPGYSGCKIVINKMKLDIPFSLKDITDSLKSYDIRRKDDNYIRCIYDGRTYIVGEVARTAILNESKENGDMIGTDDLYSMSRFSALPFKVGMNAFLGYALYRYSQYTQEQDKMETFLLSELKGWNMKVGIALPHEYLESLVPGIQKMMMDESHKFDLIVGGDEKISFDFQIKDAFFNSQTICALLSEVLDDEGNEKDGTTIFDTLPALILDGGYKTMGEFEFARDQSIQKSKSNTDYAMKNIHEKVAEKVREHVPNIYYYMIDELLNSEEVIRYLDGQKACEINIKELVDTATEETIEQLVKYLLKKYDNLLQMKTILIAGGTGSVYYPYIEKYCKKERPYLSDKIILASGNFQSEKKKEAEPIYAIAVGLFKDMLMQISQE